jgi:hypothetical protein
MFYIMKNSKLINISILLCIVILGFISLYSIIIDFHFSKEQINFLFSLLYLVLALNFLKYDEIADNSKKRFELVIMKPQNILISCVLMVFYALILVQTEASVIRIFLCLVLSLLINLLAIVLFKRKITFYLFWINFYLFMVVFVILQFPNINMDILARFNPLAGLVSYLII